MGRRHDRQRFGTVDERASSHSRSSQGGSRSGSRSVSRSRSRSRSQRESSGYILGAGAESPASSGPDSLGNSSDGECCVAGTRANRRFLEGMGYVLSARRNGVALDRRAVVPLSPIKPLTHRYGAHGLSGLGMTARSTGGGNNGNAAAAVAGGGVGGDGDASSAADGADAQPTQDHESAPFMEELVENLITEVQNMTRMSLKDKQMFITDFMENVVHQWRKSVHGFNLSVAGFSREENAEYERRVLERVVQRKAALYRTFFSRKRELDERAIFDAETNSVRARSMYRVALSKRLDVTQIKAQVEYEMRAERRDPNQATRRSLDRLANMVRAGASGAGAGVPGAGTGGLGTRWQSKAQQVVAAGGGGSGGVNAVQMREIRVRERLARRGKAVRARRPRSSLQVGQGEAAVTDGAIQALDEETMERMRESVQANSRRAVERAKHRVYSKNKALRKRAIRAGLDLSGFQPQQSLPGSRRASGADAVLMQRLAASGGTDFALASTLAMSMQRVGETGSPTPEGMHVVTLANSTPSGMGPDASSSAGAGADTAVDIAADGPVGGLSGTATAVAEQGHVSTSSSGESTSDEDPLLSAHITMRRETRRDRRNRRAAARLRKQQRRADAAHGLRGKPDYDVTSDGNGVAGVHPDTASAPEADAVVPAVQAKRIHVLGSVPRKRTRYLGPDHAGRFEFTSDGDIFDDYDSGAELELRSRMHEALPNRRRIEQADQNIPGLRSVTRRPGLPNVGDVARTADPHASPRVTLSQHTVEPHPPTKVSDVNRVRLMLEKDELKRLYRELLQGDQHLYMQHGEDQYSWPTAPVPPADSPDSPSAQRVAIAARDRAGLSASASAPNLALASDEFIKYVLSNNPDMLVNYYDVPEDMAREMQRGRALWRTAMTDALQQEQAGESVSAGYKEPVSVDRLQERLESVWALLKTPQIQKLDMTIKYSSQKWITRMEESVDLWERCTDAVMRREKHLTAIASFEREASDPRRLFRGSSVARLDEEKTRRQLQVSLDRMTEQVTTLICELELEFEDVLTYQGEPYVEKMEQDYLALVAMLEEERRRHSRGRGGGRSFKPIAKRLMAAARRDAHGDEAAASPINPRMLSIVDSAVSASAPMLPRIGSSGMFPRSGSAKLPAQASASSMDHFAANRQGPAGWRTLSGIVTASGTGSLASFMEPPVASTDTLTRADSIRTASSSVAAGSRGSPRRQDLGSVAAAAMMSRSSSASAVKALASSGSLRSGALRPFHHVVASTPDIRGVVQAEQIRPREMPRT